MTSNYPASLPVILGEVVDEVRESILATLQEYDPTIQTINYMYGNWKELSERMIEYSQNEVERFKKFPCILLIEDAAIDRRNTDYFGIADNVRIVIANHTKKEYKSEQRETINFEPILYPMYYELLYQMTQHAAIVMQNDRSLPHLMIPRKYWGVDDNTANALGDYIDAIEMANIRLTLNWYYCSTVINSTI